MRCSYPTPGDESSEGAFSCWSGMNDGNWRHRAHVQLFDSQHLCDHTSLTSLFTRAIISSSCKK